MPGYGAAMVHVVAADDVGPARVRADGVMAGRCAKELEQLVRGRHRRRLQRAGWDDALAPRPGPWAAAGSAPREGNAVEVLVDGATVLPAMCAAVSQATSHVYIAQWAIEPQFDVVREQEHLTLRELLAAAAERVDVCFLLWRGAPLPLAHPRRREADRALRELCAGTRIRGALDATGRWAAACHGKVAVIDGREAFVGGIDLTTVEGDRYDHSGHADPGGTGWHDVTARVRGPAVADVRAHFWARWGAATGERLPESPPPAPAGPSTVQLQRTVPAGRRRPGRTAASVSGRRGDFSALQGHLAALRGARRLIHLESQDLWSVEIVDALAEKLRNPPDPSFRIVVVLPRSPRAGYDASPGQLWVLAAADGGAGRFLACSLRTACGSPRREVYVHAKLAVVDDAWLSVVCRQAIRLEYRPQPRTARHPTAATTYRVGSRAGVTMVPAGTAFCRASSSSTASSGRSGRYWTTMRPRRSAATRPRASGGLS